MIHSHRLLLAVGLSWSMLLSVALGQAGIPNNLKTSGAIDGSAESLIRNYILDHTTRLAEKNPDLVSKAREALVDGARLPMGDPSPAYASKYAELINAEVCSILDKSKEPRTLLNAAVVAARVAEVCRSVQLEPAATRLLADKQPEYLKIWGARTAKSIIPELAKAGTHQKLLDRVSAALAQHPSGAMAGEAYQSLMRMTDRKALAVVVDPLLALARSRVKLYQTATPDDPERDCDPIAFLTTERSLWMNGLTQKQRFETMQLVYSLLKYSAQRADEPGSKAREQLAQVINKLAQSVYVAANHMGEKRLADQARRASEIARNPAASAKLSDTVKALLSEIKATKGFEAIAEIAAAVKVP